LAGTVVLGRKFEVHTGHLAFAGLVLDTQVGYRDLIADNLKALAGSNLRASLSAERGKVTVELPLQLEIEDDTEIPATFVEDSPGLFLVQLIEVRVVVRIFRLDENRWERTTEAVLPNYLPRKKLLSLKKKSIGWMSFLLRSRSRSPLLLKSAISFPPFLRIAAIQ
jgi:hypothetical protein